MPLPYPLNLNKEELSYSFVTDQNIVYKVYFLDYSYIFDEYPNITCPLYSFNIDAIDGNPDHSHNDERIGATVSRIINTFFENIENVALYVCDSLDGRELARKRKFDLWFFYYNDNSLFKEDGLAVIEGIAIYNSIILHKKNTQLTDIILCFKELNEKYNGK